MKGSWQVFAPVFFSLLLLMLPLKDVSASPLSRRAQPTLDSGAIHKGHTCVGCVLVVSVIEQLALIHNSTAKDAIQRLCNYLPEVLNLQGICILVTEIFGPELIKLLTYKMNADVVCHSLKLCKQNSGQPFCHLYPPPKMGLNKAIRKTNKIVQNSTVLKNIDGFSSICSLPPLVKLCEKIAYVIKNKLPYEDFDGDKFSAFPTLRGYHWRGRDCNEGKATVYPGRRPENWDVERDSNCNGIWGVDPKDGIPYEKKFCKDAESKGIILLGDSAGAHFHIPPEWMTAAQMSLSLHDRTPPPDPHLLELKPEVLIQKTFSDLPVALTNELDWPHFSGTTGFLNSTIGGWTDSLYLRLRRRNRCNHRDFQNISKNGGSSKNLLDLMKSLARNQLLDNPAIVIYATIGNDVCNGRADPVAYMTTPKQMHSNVMQTLQYLNSQLPKGSHVILTGLADGRFLWDQLHNRYHPLGQLNKDVTYEQMYSFLNCLQISPCNGWMTSNETLRNLTSERAFQLSSVLKEIAGSQMFANFDIFYMDYPWGKIADEWHKLGGEAWQLIETVDGFHPNQIASALGARIIWQRALSEWPHVLGKENPFNNQIEDVFKDQGGH